MREQMDEAVGWVIESTGPDASAGDSLKSERRQGADSGSV